MLLKRELYTGRAARKKTSLQQKSIQFSPKCAEKLRIFILYRFMQDSSKRTWNNRNSKERYVSRRFGGNKDGLKDLSGGQRIKTDSPRISRLGCKLTATENNLVS
ncbi:hypothetical protein TNCV_1769541 [Trichonephila clavipes]|nr:hypothetical protein TNCV_1769541 [Trichonephila clavipes]